MRLFGITRHLRQERAGFALYAAAVGAARDPFLYAQLGVPDTLDGRFDLVGVHVFLVIRRLRAARDRQGALVSQAVFDAMFSDMDINLREIGVGDMVIGKRVRAMWEAFHGRCAVYGPALDDADPRVLAEALARNVWRGGDGGGAHGGAAVLAHMVRRQDVYLATQATGAVVAGEARFLDSAEARR